MAQPQAPYIPPLSDELLPLPSILAKLKDIDPDAPRWIMDRAEKIQKERHKSNHPLSLKNIFRNISRALTMPTPFVLPSPQGLARHQSDTARAGWIHTGNNLRLAITHYMDKNAIDANLLLDAQERKSLKILPLPPYTPRPF